MQRKYFSFIIILIISGFLVGCNSASIFTKPATVSESSVQSQDKSILNVAVSILPYADFVKMVGGDKVQVTVMIPPGASPDSYEPSTQQLKDLSRADMYVMVGQLPFEQAWSDRLLATNQDLLVINGAKGIKLIDDNPHIWLSPRLAKSQLENIYDGLVAVDINNKAYYSANLKEAIAMLAIMDGTIKSIFAGLNSDTFLVYHPAWGYLADDYDLVEMAIEEQGKEPGPAQMAKITTKAKNLGINTVFTSSQHSTRSAEAIAEELGAKVVTLDPLPSNYEDVINSAKLISEALK